MRSIGELREGVRESGLSVGGRKCSEEVLLKETVSRAQAFDGVE
jgi:hypothetical protein